jgi:hypothetical protein
VNHEEESMSAFYQYFRENMNAMGLPAPESAFGTAGRAFDSVAAMAAAVKLFGANATVSEIVMTSPALSALATDAAALGAAVTAAYYLGACIGSAAIASGRAIADGSQLTDFMNFGDLISQNHPVRSLMAARAVAIAS